jgi:hypothetical protein
MNESSGTVRVFCREDFAGCDGASAWIITWDTTDTALNFKVVETIVDGIDGGSEISESRAEGYLKWDGCLNIDFDGSRCLHFCGPEEKPLLGRLVEAIYKLGPKMKSWDHGGGSYVEGRKTRMTTPWNGLFSECGLLSDCEGEERAGLELAFEEMRKAIVQEERIRIREIVNEVLDPQRTPQYTLLHMAIVSQIQPGTFPDPPCVDELQNPEPGMRVRIRCDPKDTRGFLIGSSMIANRRSEGVGVLWGYVPGHGGDVWYVVHEGTPVTSVDGKDVWDKNGIAAYTTRELTRA